MKRRRAYPSPDDTRKTRANTTPKCRHAASRHEVRSDPRKALSVIGRGVCPPERLLYEAEAGIPLAR